MFTIVGQTHHEDFSVSDLSGSVVAGISLDEFVTLIYDPTGNEVSASSDVVFSELGNGNYRVSFVPNIVGNWYIVVYHSVYFPYGKGANVQVFENNFDTLSNLIVRILGLSNENYYIDNTIYDEKGMLVNARVRIYDDSSNVGTDQGVISTYDVVSEYSELGQMLSYSVKKV